MKIGLITGTLALATLAVIGFGGCAHYEAKPIVAPQAVDDFKARTLKDEGLIHFLGSQPEHWDLNLLTRAAIYYHPNLDVARAQIASAEAGQITAGERPNPTLSVSPGYNSTTTLPTPWIVSPDLDVPIETAGKRGYRLAQAEHRTEVARYQFAMAAWQVRSQVRKALLAVYAAGSGKALLVKQATIQTENLRLMEAQLKAGALSPFEVTQARVSLQQAQMAVMEAEKQAALAGVQLAEAIGVPATALERVSLDFSGFNRLQMDMPDDMAQRQALLNRADLLGVLAEYAGAEATLQLEIAKQYPDIHLRPGYSFDQSDNKWSLGLAVTLPVLNQNQGAIAEAQARRTELAAKFQVVQARVLAEIELARVNYQMTLRKAEAVQELSNELEAQLRTTEGMLRAGEVSRVELTQRQLELTAAALAQNDARVAAQTAIGAFEDALQSPAVFSVPLANSPRVSRESKP
jgi:outer membrane protein, heavy metal efflux system